MVSECKQNVKAGDLLRHCWRGGSWGLIWKAQGRQSCWIDLASFDYAEVDSETFDNEAWRRGGRYVSKFFWAGDVYFGVNPSMSIPPENKRGNTDRRYIAAQTDYLACVNVVFAEYDGKDMVDASEYRRHLPGDYRRLSDREQREAVKVAQEATFYEAPDRYKARAMALLQARAEATGFIPTVIVDSGGGYHAYWFLSDTVYLDDNNRDDVAATQHDWVAMMQGDPGAADLRRVLRLPGWDNNKSGWGNDKPTVTIVHYDGLMTYGYAEIEQAVGDWAFENNRPRHNESSGGGSASWNGTGMGDVRRIFDQTYAIKDLLLRMNYTLCSEDRSGFIRMARPDKTDPSVTIFPANDQFPEIAVHHSGNDALHWGETKRVDENGDMHRGLDAWLVFVHLYYKGNAKRAYIAAKKFLGLWEDRPADGAGNQDVVDIEVV